MAEASLLTDLHSNLWGSLRHVFNTDRLLLAVTYAINFAGFLLLSAVWAQRPLARVFAILALVVLNGLIMLSLHNSKLEAVALLSSLASLYHDQGLGKYFDESRLLYYRRRYSLWLVLTPTLCAAAIAIAFALGR